jgi:hypothetical protein
VKSGIRAPDEARARLNLPPVPGGKYPYLQQQNFSLEALAKRDAQEDPFGTKPKPEPVAPPASSNDDEVDEDAEVAAALADAFVRKLMDSSAPAPTAAMNTVISAANHIERSHDRVIQRMEELELLLASPVEPIYDDRGMLIGARRVPKPKDGA